MHISVIPDLRWIVNHKVFLQIYILAYFSLFRVGMKGRLIFRRGKYLSDINFWHNLDQWTTSMTGKCISREQWKFALGYERKQ